MPYLAHVEASFSSAHGNGPEGHKCQEMHGHDWRVEVEWTYGVADLDAFGWGVDFGAIKKLIERLDHKNLNTLFPFPPSAENIASYLYDAIRNQFQGRVGTLAVTVHEGKGNRVTYKEQ